jgi:hypothetical protein
MAAAYSCDRTMTALHLWLGAVGGSMTVVAFVQRWILNFVILSFFSYLFLYSASLFKFFVAFGQ